MKRISERPFLPKPPGTESPYIATLMRCMTNVLGEIAFRLNGTLPKDGSEDMTAPATLASSTVAGLSAFPAASWEGSLLYISNETGGKTVAFSDGTNWRRVQDRNIVS